MGKDGYYNSTNSNKYIARDVYSYQLNYFDGDYTPISGDNPFVKTGVHSLPATSGTTTQTMAKQLYNGNIASMFVNIPKIGNAQLCGYQYDQLNRLVGMDAYNSFSNHKNNWTGSTPTNLPSNGYQERISYDANGNILTYLRNGALGASGIAMDNMSYQYPKAADGKLLSNQLRYVHDAASTSAYTTDIKNNAPSNITQANINAEKLAVNQPGDNYQYDKIGNLIADKKEDIINIEWTVYGKINTITKSNSSIQYTYDASGNRISKAVTTNGQTNYTYYVRDASGNVMSVYEKNSTLNGNLLTQSEVHLYGSSRLGVININRQAEVFTPGPNDEFDMGYFARGKKLYELTNHLGNVLVTISDKKTAVPLVPGAIKSIVAYYTAEVVTANDYYPFGMTMPGRKYEQPNSNYRFGFNGKEQDKETTGTSTYDYGFRIYNPGLGRFLSVDPLSSEYPFNSTYAFAENRVIDGVDLEGLEYATVIYHYYYGSTKPVFTVVWNNVAAHNEFGNKGRGVAFKTQHYDQNGKIASESPTLMFRRSAEIILAKTDYGFYYGLTQMEDFYLIKKYILPPIDAVDEAGRIHDKAYDAVGANANNATNSWGSIEADEGIIAACSKVIKLGTGAIDPFDNGNGQKITSSEVGAAINGKNYFKLSQWNKIEAVSDWMEKNYKSESKKGSGFWNDNEDNQRSNYNLFRSKYMHQDSEGTWVENLDMWKDVGK